MTAAPRPLWRRIASPAAKLVLTIGAFYLLLTHPVQTDGNEKVVALEAIRSYLPNIEVREFLFFSAIAFLIRITGMFCSMLRWHLLLRGQGLKFPFVHIATTFLIGRFLGTFLPSTVGLDGYKLYDAARFSGRTVEAAAATVIEKGMGIVGIFLCFLITLPFGFSILGKQAGTITAITVPIAVSIVVSFFLVMLHPSLVPAVLDRLPVGRSGRIAGFLARIQSAATAYGDQKALLVFAGVLSFGVHFFTAITYFFTALAVGAAHADLWQVLLASTIQIFATVMSPFTIAGEGVREIVQALLLARHIGMEQSILSAALGFWVAEAPTLSGGLFYLMRSPNYRPRVELTAPGR